jgi:MFS family permease
MAGLTEAFMVPYALALGADAFQVGLLTSVRNLVLSLVQVKTADAARWFRSRRRLVLATAILQALLWLPIAGIPWVSASWAVVALIAFYTAGTASAAFGGPAWGSLVSEYLAPEERGRFFGRLARIGGLSRVAVSIAAGGVLQLVAATPLAGFAGLCLCAAASRALSAYWLARLPEPAWREHGGERFGFWRFLRQAATSNFARFAVCVGMMSFAVNLSAPYMAVYLLREHDYGYLAYTLVIEAGAAAAFLAASRWGQVGDRHGNWLVLRWAMAGVSVLPFLWALSGSRLWMLAVSAGGGVLWGGYNLAVVNFIYDVATPPKRARCLAYFNVINGVGVSLGALTGGWLIGHLPPLAGSAFVTLFCVSATLRMVVAWAFPRVVREVRTVGPVGLRHLIYDLVGQRLVNVLGLLPTARDQNAAAAEAAAPRRDHSP